MKGFVLLAAIALTASLAGAQGNLGVAVDSPAARVTRHREVVVLPALPPSSLVLVNAEDLDRSRSEQLALGVPNGGSLLLRSPSSMTPRKRGFSVIAPQLLFVSNTQIPFSQNYGALWAGRGLSTRTLLGIKIESPRARLILAPEIIVSANKDWRLDSTYYVPPVPSANNGRGYAFPYYAWTYPVDQPLRFGPNRIRRFDLGQSTAMVLVRSLELGFSNEHEWWGPGIRNAIVLSNNAPGFPHLFVRTARPVDTRFGGVEMRWLVGGLTESRYFDTVSTNNIRSLAAFAATLQTRWDPNLSIGLARSVYATATGWGEVPWRWFDVLARTNHGKKGPLVPFRDTTLTPGGKDQIFSLFARWVFPADGFEVYAEWARQELRPSLRDFLTAPDHTQGYTLGAQWRGGAWRSGTFRLQSEITQLEQSATFRDRPVGSWYTSRRVVQGYTNRGEVIGASIGPGASSQWLALDYLKPGWRFGTFAGRIRWNEDVHSTFGFPVYVGYCNHDVSVYPGIRGAKVTGFGSFSAELSLQNRLNAFFQNGGGCPNVGPRRDIRNNTLSVSFSPFTRR